MERISSRNEIILNKPIKKTEKFQHQTNEMRPRSQLCSGKLAQQKDLADLDIRLRFPAKKNERLIAVNPCDEREKQTVGLANTSVN